MWNPIVSGSTDFWQHVCMYYSMPVEVWASGRRTQDYRQACPYILKKTIQAHVIQRCKELKYTDKNNNCFFFSSVWWHIMQQIETWSQSTERSRGPKLKLQKKKKKIKDGVWPQQGHTEVLLNRSCYSSRIRSQHFIFIAVMFNQLPWELGHPLLLLPSLHLHPSLQTSIAFPRHKEVLPET